MVETPLPIQRVVLVDVSAVPSWLTSSFPLFTWKVAEFWAALVGAGLMVSMNKVDRTTILNHTVFFMIFDSPLRRNTTWDHWPLQANYFLYRHIEFECGIATRSHVQVERLECEEHFCFLFLRRGRIAHLSFWNQQADSAQITEKRGAIQGNETKCLH